LWSDKYGNDLNPQRDIIIGESKKDRVKALTDIKKRLYKTHILSNAHEENIETK
jgi:hypothetical protein